MFWQYGLFYSILSGCIWGVFWQIFFTVVGILTLGTPLNLELSQMMIIGPLAGILCIKSQKFLSLKFHIITIIAITILIFTLHLGDPYQASNENPLTIILHIKQQFLLVFFKSYL